MLSAKSNMCVCYKTHFYPHGVPLCFPYTSLLRLKEITCSTQYFFQKQNPITVLWFVLVTYFNMQGKAR